LKRDSISEWGKKHPDFSAACARAQGISQLWWESQLHAGLSNREFQASACLTAMKARFSEWREPSKIEITGSGGGPIEFTSAIAAAREMLKKEANTKNTSKISIG
jgi:hypothetical protein